MKAVVAAFNQEKALVGAFSVITNLRMELFEALEKARALFPMFSLINHSCSANAKHTIYIKNRRIAVQAQTSIREGEEILINYTAFIIGTSMRRRKLYNNW